ncbi:MULTISPECIES: catechol 2,3-dioxygenase [Pandoraea]|uniref:Metapyrocatechase n=1 Tax=Pandoraea communis TaxID=2508297 RepID=A0A5E4XTZ1_9BURK|nr:MULTISPECIES: catechol 2,3-dioxygenase [Pandoraea]ALS66640.1 catechol 2,3-dioxygenase [Pandoraea apista]CFB61376.1 Metapyrocatechase [Pandoraea apista]VVE39867.1 catechol 2,3-dioxygenase [Pandoraea communis]
MALTGVLRPGHAQIRVTDLEDCVHFYTNVLGLKETGRDRSGRVYLKAWDERDHHSLVLRCATEPGLDFFGFKVLDRATLMRLDSDLRAWGVHTEAVPAGDMLETGDRIRFEVPSGHVIELYAEKTEVGTAMSVTNPAPWCADAERGIAPMRMDHAQLNGTDIDGAREIFTDVLGFYVTERLLMEDGRDQGVWLSCSNKAHDVALVRHDTPGRLHHVSFLLESWERILRAADLMSMHGAKKDIGPTRHGITRGATIYAFDPSGNRFETFCGTAVGYPDQTPLVWTHEETGTAIFYHDREMHEPFLTVMT